MISTIDIVGKLTTTPGKNILIIIKEAQAALDGFFCIYNKLDSKNSVLIGRSSEMDESDDPIIDEAAGHICYELTMAGLDKPVIISDIDNSEFGSSDSTVAKYNLKSYLGVPVRIGDLAIGSLAIVDTKVRNFTENEIEIISTLALLIMLEEEHKMTLEGLKSSDTRYHAVFENANDCIMLLKDDIIIDINNKGCEIFGYSRDEMIKKSSDEFNPSADILDNSMLENQKGFLAKVLEGEPQRFEWVHQKKDGTNFYSEISLTKLDGNEDYNVLAIIRDITTRKDYEKSLIDANKKSEESNRMKSLSLASMSHELRTPLNSIIGFSDLLLDDDTTEDEKEMFSKLIQTAGRSLMQLIADIVDISKIEAGEVTIQKEIFNVNSFLQEVLLTFKQEKEKRGKANIELKLVLSDQATELKIETDTHRLRQVFNNLITNSLKFIDEGFIEFGYSSVTPDNIQFYVKDTGVGIGSDKKERIFEQYGQDEDTYNRNTEGTGLGLAISKSFVELLGGSIWVDSELDEGSTFYFTIPNNRLTDGNDNFTCRSLNIDSYNWSGRTILIVDDVKENYVFLKGLLNHTKVNILWAKDGSEAVDVCRGNQLVDMVLMDIRMPVMDGFEATKLIKKDNPDIVVIAQTAFASYDDKKRCTESGCDEYLKKPIDYKELFSAISKYYR